MKFLCVGHCAIDVKYRLDRENGIGARRTVSAGGVVRNVAENLARLGAEVDLLAAVGADPAGDGILRGLRDAGVSIARLERSAEPTSECAAVLAHDGRLLAEAFVGGARLDDRAILASLLARPDDDRTLVLDDGLRADALVALLRAQAFPAVALIVSGLSGARGLPADLRGLDLFLNYAEAQAACERDPEHRGSTVEALLRSLRRRGGGTVVVTAGPNGAWGIDRDGAIVQVPGEPAEALVDETGCGDAAAAAVLHALAAGLPLEAAVRRGMRAGAATIASPLTVLPNLAGQLGPLPERTPSCR